ncbi:hypothetical protein ES705_02729 [subsurface metagenome]
MAMSGLASTSIISTETFPFETSENKFATGTVAGQYGQVLVINIFIFDFGIFLRWDTI